MTTTDSPSKASKYQNLFTQLEQNRFVRPIGFSAFAVFLVVGATLRNPAWFITGKGQIDPWLYWGTGEIMEYTAEHFSLTYYFRRWTLTFPNFIFQNLLPPVEAQFVLRSLILFAILVLAGTFVYSLSKSIVTSLFVMGLISSSSFLLAGIGNSYHEGTGLVFFLALLLLLTKLRDNQAKIKSKAFLVGVMFALFFVTYQFAMFIFFPVALAVLWSAGREAWRHSKDYFFPFSLGFLLIDILDFSIGLFFRYWPELLSYTFLTGSSIRSSGEFAPDVTRYISDFLPSSANFPLPLILIGMLLLLVQTKSMQRWFPLGLIGIALMYLLLPLFGLIGAQVLHTAVYGVMATLLGAGIAISGIVDKASERLVWSVWRRDALKAAALTLIVLLSIYTTDESWLILVSIGTGFLALALVLSRYELKKESKAFSNLSAMISAIILSITVLSQGLPYPASPRSDLDKVAQENSVRMTVLSKEVRALAGYATANDYRIFILDNRPHEGWSETISAFYGMYSSISEGYPAPTVDCNRLAYAASRENPRFILIHEGDPDGSNKFMEEYLSPCSLYAPVLEDEVPGIDASVFRLEARLGP
jgi:hypothetical protein